MSESLTVDAEPTRRSRRDRPEREIHRESEPSVQIEAVSEQISPEQALADAQQQLKDRDRQLAEERRLKQQEVQARQKAENTAAQANVARQTDRTSVVSSAIEAAQAEQAAAELALTQAHESGDIKGVAAATKLLSGATYRLSQASAELDWLKNQPKPQGPTQQPDAPSEAAQKWLQDHPAFYSDEAYRSTAEGAHNSAVRAQHAPGSPSYIQHIEGIMTRVYGEGHGQGEAAPRREAAPTREASPRGDSLPPSRGRSSGGGYQKVSIPTLGEVQYLDRSDGTRSIRFTSAAQAETFREGAEISRMTLAQYADDQINHMLEGGGDLKHGDGGRWE